jgi:hypothetical protein
VNASRGAKTVAAGALELQADTDAR